MPSALRAQVALIALLGVLLIPIGTSSLRGLTHILTCQESAAAPFSIEVPEDGLPFITSSSSFERNPDGSVPDTSVCEGVECPTGSHCVEVCTDSLPGTCWSECAPDDETPACEDLADEAACDARADCVPLYTGYGCSCDARPGVRVDLSCQHITAHSGSASTIDFTCE